MFSKFKGTLQINKNILWKEKYCKHLECWIFLCFNLIFSFKAETGSFWVEDNPNWMTFHKQLPTFFISPFLHFLFLNLIAAGLPQPPCSKLMSRYRWLHVIAQGKFPDSDSSRTCLCNHQHKNFYSPLEACVNVLQHKKPIARQGQSFALLY